MPLATDHPDAAAAPDLEDISPAAVRSASRPAARTLFNASNLPEDAFLHWFIDVVRPRSDPAKWRRSPRSALTHIAPVRLNLPDPATLAPSIRAWAAEDPDLARWLDSSLGASGALARWGARLIRSGKVQQSVAAFHAATALDPESPLNWCNFGVALDQAGAITESAACLERSLLLARTQPDTWLQLGTVRKKQGDFARAETAYRAAVELDSSQPLAWQCLGLLKEAQSDAAGAVDCYLAAVERGGAGAALFTNLGRLCYSLGRFVDAHAYYTQALAAEPGHVRAAAAEPKLRFIRDVLERIPAHRALKSLRHPADGSPGASEAQAKSILEAAFGALAGFGHRAEALAVGRLAMAKWPTDSTMAYLVAALEGTEALDRSPASYLVDHFDRFASQFDRQLVGHLGYDVPETLCAEVRAAVGAATLGDTLDAGCGTGLCCPHLRVLTRRLTGVDLSPGMLAEAEKRGGYDSLVCEELLSFLPRHPRGFDLIVAADVLIYLGDLSGFLASAAYALRPGGWLAVSTELAGGSTYELRPSGRFAHAERYVIETASPELNLVSCRQTTLRLEGSERTKGNLFVFRKR